jgi:Ni,Fe-hydrogenase III small subunit
MTTPKLARRASVLVLPLETGGCGACTQSISALHAPGFASKLNAEGISFANSPRHADVILLAGPMSVASRAAVRRMIEAAPLPRAIIAVGDCAIDGCVFAGSRYLPVSVAEDLDVNVEIAGCPPSPDAILAAISEAARLLAGSDRKTTASALPDDGDADSEGAEDDADADAADDDTSDDGDPGDDVDGDADTSAHAGTHGDDTDEEGHHV